MISKQAYEIATSEYMKYLYLEQKLGLSAIQKLFHEKHSIKASVGFFANRLKEFGIGLRTSSESRRIVAKSLDWSQSFLDQKTVEAIDGFLIGDGSAHVKHDKQIARIGCGVQHKEFCDYFRSFFLKYDPQPSKYYPDKSGRSSGTWNFRTRFHPDLYRQAARWYPQYGSKKTVPQDVLITSLSVMMWYLGDGSVSVRKHAHTCTIQLSTDSFSKESIENTLITKMRDKNIKSHRNNDNRLIIDTRSIPQFFNLIGRKSPVKCYDYKFDIPEWRFESMRMSDVAELLNVDYNRLCHLVKRGIQPCYRASDGGRPRFLPEHIEFAKNLIANGILNEKE